MVNDYVAAFINFFAYSQRGHNTLLHSFQRSGRYRAMIQRVMAEEGVPQDLIYLAVAESGFQPRAIDSQIQRRRHVAVHAPRFYGLKRNAYVDERFDPEKSTRAYARYMKFIYDQLGDWYLAWPPTTGAQAMCSAQCRRPATPTSGSSTSATNCPETQNYVPEILAAIIIANHPTQYGFDDVTLDPPVLTDTVTINYSVDLRLVSDLVGAPVDESRRSTPACCAWSRRPTLRSICICRQARPRSSTRVALVPEAKRNAWRYHRVAADDTLASVAREFRVAAVGWPRPINCAPR